MFFPSLSGGSGSGAKTPGAPTFTTAAPSTSDGKGPTGDITGRFDPTALERGAKALRELDGSPNAAKAFEVTKLQEMTKQKEIMRDMEHIQQAKTQLQAERARVEGDEKRKTLTHQQEQERITAQYKAQLEAEAYSKKLQDQQKQNEEWLAQQHQQFLRQEEIRKRNEKDLLEMRRAQIQEEKAMERELMKMKIQEETKGRIQQERENIDIHLREMRARAAEDRKTRLDVVQSSFSSIGAAFTAILEDRGKMTTLVAGLSALAIGIYGARAGTAVAGKYVEARLGRPPLVRETSRWSLSRTLIWRNLWQRTKPNFQEKIVLPEELSERLQWTTNSLLAARKNGSPFRHLLLHGHPGTGKTLFARTLARESGMDYAIMTGGDVGPLGKDAVNEVNKLFHWANHSKKGLILFVDEAEAFLRQGRGAAEAGVMSEDVRNVLSAFLHHTGTESDKFCVILATNVKEILDRAVLDRIDEQFEFPLPGFEERRRMIMMFFDEYIHQLTRKGKKIKVDTDIDDAFLELIAKKTEAFSGRQLAKLVISMQAAVFGSGSNTLTRGLAETVLHWKLAHIQEDIDTIDRSNRQRLLDQAAQAKLVNPNAAY